MPRLKGQYFDPDSIDGLKFRLLNNQSLRARNAAGTGDIALWKANASDQLEPGADINLNNKKITGLPTPTADSDAVSKEYVASQVLSGPAGADGAAGTPGSVFRSASGAPLNSLGVNNDLYLDTATGNVYVKAAGTYSLSGNIKGPSGSNGTIGSNGTNGATWRVGAGAPSNSTGSDGDLWLNSSTGAYYIKTAGVYGMVGNLTGPPGVVGSLPQSQITNLVADLAAKADAAATDAALNLKANASDVATQLATKQDLMPSPTGNAGKFVSSDGDDFVFATPGLTLNRVATGAADYNYNTANPPPNIIEVSDLTISRNVNLPGCEDVADGWSLDVVDFTGVCSTAKKITLLPNSIATEGIGTGSSFQLSSSNASVSMYNNRPAKKWMIRSSFGTGGFVIAPFIPTTNLLVRLDATSASNFSFSGSNITQWNDISGNGRHFVGAGGTTTRSTSAFGGNGGVSFTPGGNSILQSNAAFSTLIKNNWTVVMVVNRKANNATELLRENSAGTITYLLGSNSYNRMGMHGQIYSAYGFPKNRGVVYAINNNNGVLTYYMNGVKCANFIAVSGTLAKYQLTSGFSNLQIGNATNMDCGAMLIYSGAKTDSEHQSIAAFYMNQFALTPLTSSLNIIADGNSIMQGASTTLNMHMEDALAAMGTAGVGPSSVYTAWDYINFGTSGYRTAQMVTRAPTLVDPLYDSTKLAKYNIVVMWEGSNEIADSNGSFTAQNGYDNYKAYCVARKAAGWKVVVLTTLPRTAGLTNTNYESIRAGQNTLIRNNAISEGWADQLCDVGGDATIGGATVPNSGTYYYDGIHLTDAGSNVVKGYIQTALTNIINGA